MAERVLRRPREVVVDLVVDDFCRDDAALRADVRRSDGAPFEPLVARIVRAQRVVELEPCQRHVVGVHVPINAPDVGGVQLLVEHPEGVIISSREQGGGRTGALEAVRTLLRYTTDIHRIR